MAIQKDEKPQGRKIRGSNPKGYRKPTTLDDLNEDPENPREIEVENLEGLQVSMVEFGDLSGIVFNLRTRQLVAGHQRRDGLQKKFGNLPIQFEGERAWISIPGKKDFPIRMVDWDLGTQRAANLAANNPHIAGHFSNKLQSQLDEIRARNGEMFKGLRLHQLSPAKLPDFQPGSQEQQGKLDIKAIITCPHCHKEFQRK